MEKSLYHSIQLPGVTLPGNLFLAPLAGYTDKAFREIAKIYGADFCYTEMVSAEAIARGNQKTHDLMERGDSEEALGIQIFLSQPDQAERALPDILHYSPSLIDINCGCPVPKVVKTGAGAALMQQPERIYALVRRLSSATEIPITVKIRSGWNESSINFEEAGRAAVEGGASMLGIHARTRLQGYSGTSRWEHIARLAEMLPVPVIGSGDLFSPQAAKDMLQQTGCAGVMFARGAIGNPLIFQQTRSLLSTKGDVILADNSEDPMKARDAQLVRRLTIGYYHLQRELHYKNEPRACAEMKKHLSAYTKGFPDSSNLRNKLMRCTSLECYRQILQEYLQHHFSVDLQESLGPLNPAQ
ncbi:MAG: tRNA dihydrouridine synthase DusB [Spirochaetaceae bacterium]|nr:tRNA dihydrouridine synthase DusB [Spirochaetaceae bacterium]MCF7946971.1 tRNA dihydrouridine synthase DusB [Spirochaetia bacterium]MCF7951096.1 tRNA dihydrouridine synthase DusB [Spirochaetaceae bacterium]